MLVSSWLCQSPLALSVSPWPCQSHTSTVSLTSTLSVSSLPSQSSLYHVSLQSLCCSLTVTMSFSPLPCQPHLSFIPLPCQPPMALLQSHPDLVSLIVALSVSPLPCQSPMDLFQSHCDHVSLIICLVSLPSTLSVSSGLVAISLWPCQSHHCLVSLTLALSLYQVSLQLLCCNLTVTLSVSPWRWLFWTWMPSAFGPWASSTAPSGSCLSLPLR